MFATLTLQGFHWSPANALQGYEIRCMPHLLYIFCDNLHLKTSSHPFLFVCRNECTNMMIKHLQETYSKNLATRTDQTNKFALSLTIICREKIFPSYFIDKALTNRPLSMVQVKTVTIDKTTSMLTVSHVTCQVTHIY